MGLDAQESFAEFDVDGNMEDGVGVEMAQLYSLKPNKAAEETPRWQTKSNFVERFEYLDFLGLFVGEVFSEGILLVADIFLREEAIVPWFFDLSLHQVVGSPILHGMQHFTWRCFPFGGCLSADCHLPGLHLLANTATLEPLPRDILVR